MGSSRLTGTVLGVCGLGCCGLLAWAGAASRPGGIWLGVPALPGLALVALSGAALATVKRWREGLRPCAGLLVPVVLLCIGPPLAGMRAVSGPPLVALALAGASVFLAVVGWRPGRLAFLPLAYLVLTLAAGRAHLRVGPQGDEPHYLMVAQSLLRDGDLSLERDYAEARYAVFHDGPLAPHYRVRGQHGEIFSLHAVGLSLLILPAWALAGYAGVTAFMALLSALLAWELRQWAAELTGREDVADATAWVFVLSPPLLHYAGLVFSEVPAALAVVYGLRRGRSERMSLAGALAVGAAAAALPWLNVRYAPLAVLLVAHAVWRQRGTLRALALLAPLVASGLGVALYHHALYGFWDPRRVYGRRPELALTTLGEGLPGLFFDQEFGLLVYAPVFVLAVPGLAFLLRRDRKLGLTALFAVAAVVFTAGSWHMWRGGFNPPGRFLIPVAPILALGLALVWERWGLTAGAALLVGWGLWTGIGGCLEPQLVHRDRDGTAPFFRQLSGAREWTGLLPGYVLEDADRHRLAAFWAVALALAVPWRARRATGGRVAAASLGLVAAAQLAAGLGRGRTEDRDAVRLVGRPALAVPGWVFHRAAVGEWASEALGWGPLYEPHRHPAGAVVGRRLLLVPGRYRLDLEAEGLSARSPAPLLETVSDSPGAVARSTSLQPVSTGFTGVVMIRAGEREIDLRLQDGGPILLKALRLSAQPSGP
jgi:hypothetical protein